jgi:MoaA/NifB/PqqE/SkfB family radical SAM enzyme
MRKNDNKNNTQKDKYKIFIECSVPGTACNFRCSYCYVSQLNDLTNRTIAKYEYPPNIVGKALSQERIGGCAYINVCGEGETLLSKQLPEYIKEMLLQGHYVNIYTNGTIDSAFEEFDKFPAEFLTRLSFSFSLHWIELLRTNLLKNFFNNFNKMKNSGCSMVCNMVLDDSYLPCVEQIKESCLDNIGAYPQISFPKKANKNGNYTAFCKDREATEKIGDSFNSPYFDFTKKYFDYDRKFFCYAGAWSFCLNLETGNITKCYEHAIKQNIFQDIYKKIKYEAVGNYCCSKCCGGGLLLPQGLAPELNVCSYIELKDRPKANWYTKKFINFLSQQLRANNKEYSSMQKKYINIIHPISNFYYRLKNSRKYIYRLFSRTHETIIRVV